MGNRGALKRFTMIAASGVVALGGCSLAPQAQLIQQAKEAVSHDLNDPESAQFRDVVVCSADQTVVRGEVNAKNLFGAYIGFKPFYFADNQVADLDHGRFTDLMNRCFGKSATAETMGAPSDGGSTAAQVASTATGETMDDISVADANALNRVEVASRSQVAAQCWQDYCPCDRSDPDYGGMDATLCRNLRGGVDVDDQLFAAAAASRDARRQIREFDGGE